MEIISKSSMGELVISDEVLSSITEIQPTITK